MCLITIFGYNAISFFVHARTVNSSTVLVLITHLILYVLNSREKKILHHRALLFSAPPYVLFEMSTIR